MEKPDEVDLGERGIASLDDLQERIAAIQVSVERLGRDAQGDSDPPSAADPPPHRRLPEAPVAMAEETEADQPIESPAPSSPDPVALRPITAAKVEPAAPAPPATPRRLPLFGAPANLYALVLVLAAAGLVAAGLVLVPLLLVAAAGVVLGAIGG